MQEFNKTSTDQPQRLIKVRQAAQYHGISERKLCHLTKDQRVPAIKFDRVVRYDQFIILDSYSLPVRILFYFLKVHCFSFDNSTHYLLISQYSLNTFIPLNQKQSVCGEIRCH